MTTPLDDGRAADSGSPRNDKLTETAAIVADQEWRNRELARLLERPPTTASQHNAFPKGRW